MNLISRQIFIESNFVELYELNSGTVFVQFSSPFCLLADIIISSCLNQAGHVVFSSQAVCSQGRSGDAPPRGKRSVFFSVIFFHSVTVAVTVLDSLSCSVCHCPISAGQCSTKYRPFWPTSVRLKIAQIALIDSHVKSVFFSNFSRYNAFSMGSGGARPNMLSSYVTSQPRKPASPLRYSQGQHGKCTEQLDHFTERSPFQLSQ